jgi:hypothetical protein
MARPTSSAAAYLRYEKIDESVDVGWPKKIGRDHVTGNENWPGMIDAKFTNKIRAAVDLFLGDVFIDDALISATRP